MSPRRFVSCLLNSLHISRSDAEPSRRCCPRVSRTSSSWSTARQRTSACRRTRDYKRHGTTALFAALDVKVGTIIGKRLPRHRSQECRRFLDTVETHAPGHLDIQIVMDNAPSHKTKLIRDWFAKRPRWQMYFSPTSSSWINQVERPPRWRSRSPPGTPTPGRSVGPKRPTTSSPPSHAFVAAPSQSKPNVNSNF